MKGKNSRETDQVARVFLEKNSRKKAVLFAIKGLRFDGCRGPEARPRWALMCFTADAQEIDWGEWPDPFPALDGSACANQEYPRA
jgi:hypothetical protein